MLSYTLFEIAANNGKNGKPTWIIIKGDVYNVTQFLSEHPGGDEVIKEYGGKDATKAFNEAGHSTDAIKDMKKYKIGIVAVNSQPLSSLNVIETNTSKTFESQQSVNSYKTNKSEKRRRMKFLFCL